MLEARCMYGYMMFSRNIYRELFSLCLEVYAGGFDERRKVFDEVKGKSGLPARPSRSGLRAIREADLQVLRPFAHLAVDNCVALSPTLLSFA